MRAAIALLVLLSLSACSDETPTALARPTASVAGEAVPLPTGLTCPDGKPTTLQLDDGGDRSFTELLTIWSKERGRPVVDRAGRQIWFVRADGSAHTVLEWTRVRRPVAGRTWFVEGLEQCSDHARWRDVAAPSVPVELTIGHCWIEPVAVEGRRWDVAEEDQFGWGGPMPRGVATGDRPGLASELTTSGRLTLAGDVATYLDESGVRLTLVPADGPWTVTRGGCD